MHLPTRSDLTSRRSRLLSRRRYPSNQTVEFSGAIQAALRQTPWVLGLQSKRMRNPRQKPGG